MGFAEDTLPNTLLFILPTLARSLGVTLLDLGIGKSTQVQYLLSLTDVNLKLITMFGNFT